MRALLLTGLLIGTLLLPTAAATHNIYWYDGNIHERHWGACDPCQPRPLYIVTNSEFHLVHHPAYTHHRYSKYGQYAASYVHRSAPTDQYPAAATPRPYWWDGHYRITY